MDAALPPLDVTPATAPAACADGGATSIYLVTVNANLLKYDPAAPSAFPVIGHLNCPVMPVAGTCNGASPTPFSMAVDRTGVAYVVYCNGQLFRVSTVTTACDATGFSVPPSFSPSFGMAFSQDETDPNETLFVASGNNAFGIPSTLASIRTSDDTLHLVAPFDPPIDEAELTGTGAGGLFAFYMTDHGTSSAIAQIDKTTAHVTAELSLPGLAMGTAWAFVFWGGDFYTFTAPSSASIVTRVHPGDGAMTPLASINDQVVGAGVSTCAPQQ